MLIKRNRTPADFNTYSRNAECKCSYLMRFIEEKFILFEISHCELIFRIREVICHTMYNNYKKKILS